MFAMKSGKYYIGKAIVFGQPTYTLTFMDEILGNYASADEAKAAAFKHDQQELGSTV